uniref:SCP domain-containing protein n=1 Tax=Strongyloides papillosus TaxID=174720 RepID=A0A0N5BSJ3_STREA
MLLYNKIWLLIFIFLSNLYSSTNGLVKFGRIKCFDNDKGFNYSYLKIPRKCINVNHRRRVVFERLHLLRKQLLLQNRNSLKKHDILEGNLSLKTNFDIEKFKRKFVIKHNLIRRNHHVPSLIISRELEEEAQRYAEKLAFMNNGLRHDKNNLNHGENLYYGRFLKLPNEEVLSESILEKFYSEIMYYNYNSFNPQNHHRYGHFTQMIWKSTTEIGVGVGLTRKNIRRGLSKTSIYIVVRYNPEGNILSEDEFKKNVL